MAGWLADWRDYIYIHTYVEHGEIRRSRQSGHINGACGCLMMMVIYVCLSMAGGPLIG